jgi:glycerol uptake facilitator-like aquaporin
MSIARSLGAEALGAAVLSAVVIGSGILAFDAARGDVAVALLGNTLATAAILVVLIVTLGPVSGAHFNPAVSLVMVMDGALKPWMLPLYVVAQISGCVLGALWAHAMFDLPLIQIATNERDGLGRLIGEASATFMLVFAILASQRLRPDWTPTLVALTIAAGYWWTSSTSFANPAITVARALSDTFAGVRPLDAARFIPAQCAGAIIAFGFAALIAPRAR